jgi:SAM-dependent methyltransferase
VRDYYEELWRSLPAQLDPPDRALRTQFLLSQIERGERVLDLGCGDGWMTAELARAGAAPTGIEIAQAAIDRARARHPELDLRLAPIDGPLPVKDSACDVVWASEVVEHVADTAKWFSEVRRVLRPQGRLLLTTPNHSRLRLLVGGIEVYSEPLGDHLHLYSAGSLRDVLRDFDFEEIQIRRGGGPPLGRRMLLAAAMR